jgi:hypothetical protein
VCSTAMLLQLHATTGAPSATCPTHTVTATLQPAPCTAAARRTHGALPVRVVLLPRAPTTAPTPLATVGRISVIGAIPVIVFAPVAPPASPAAIPLVVDATAVTISVVMLPPVTAAAPRSTAPTSAAPVSIFIVMLLAVTATSAAAGATAMAVAADPGLTVSVITAATRSTATIPIPALATAALPIWIRVLGFPCAGAARLPEAALHRARYPEAGVAPPAR